MPASLPQRAPQTASSEAAALATAHDNNAVAPGKIWQVITASSVGTVIEWYDFYIFGSLTPIISTLFFPEGNPVAALLSTLALFATGFVVRPFGAIVFGRLGDLVGRKYTFLLTLLLMGGSTFCIGVVPTYAQIGLSAPLILLVLRLVQGLALGGEYGGAATYVAEHAPDNRRGYYTSFIQTTATVGLFVSIAVIVGTRMAVGDAAFKDWGWRIPFLVSFFLIIASYYIRRRLHESPLFAQMKAQGKTSTSPVRDSFVKPENRRLVLLALFGATMGQGVVWYTGQFYAYFFLQTVLKIDLVPASTILCLALLLGTPFFVYFGGLSDRIGRKRIIMTGLLCAVLFTFPLFYGLHAFAGPITEVTPASVDAAGKAVPAVLKALSPNIPMLTVLVFCLVLFVTMVYGPIAAYLVELFPTKVRYTSLSLPYHVGNGIFGGLVPLIATALVAWAAAQPSGFLREYSIYFGLLYPVVVALICLLIGSAKMKDIRNVRIMD
ncbi:MHS family MFS transporter [Hymenobacter busanensis]|uniref:MHS family MFS transporter n=1 Tax=Hymenobacter busanensis TaxID=2607656 RepID=A0A7L4ZU89_9BACT|nr:MFS transporter [Hymenobacter busanensis]KAA9339698.1 MHS family MFS transporter [Hymenobacter busanensis]QHJ06547.1 MFS transporter [Hymenobacter busanensis]